MKSWYSIKAVQAKGVTTADISIHDEIGYYGVTAKAFLADLKALGAVSVINLSIHSGGGEVFDGWAIYNALAQHAARVVVTIQGLCASMASVIAMAGDEIRMPENAYMMIHKVSGFAFGDSKNMEDTASLFTKLEKNIISAYASKTKLSEDELQSMMDAETWMDGTEAKEKGFVDVLLARVEVAALCKDKLGRFGKVPTGLFDTTPQAMTKEEIEAEKKKIADAQAAADKLMADAVALSDKAKADIAAAEKLMTDAKVIEDKATADKAAADKALADAKAAEDKSIADNKATNDRLDKIEALAKSGVIAAAGAPPPVAGQGGKGEDDKDTTPRARATAAFAKIMPTKAVA